MAFASQYCELSFLDLCCVSSRCVVVLLLCVCADGVYVFVYVGCVSYWLGVSVVWLGVLFCDVLSCCVCCVCWCVEFCGVLCC